MFIVGAKKVGKFLSINFVISMSSALANEHGGEEKSYESDIRAACMLYKISLSRNLTIPSFALSK